MARLPPSRHPLHCDLRIPDLRARDDFPLNRSCHQGVPAICLTRRLPAQRIRRCDPNATFRTRLQQCDGDWLPLSPRCYRVAHAARLGTDIEICDTVRLGGIKDMVGNSVFGRGWHTNAAGGGTAPVVVAQAAPPPVTPIQNTCSNPNALGISRIVEI